MKKFLLGALLALASCFAFSATYVAVQGDDYVVVRTDVPCSKPVLEQIEAKKMPVPVEQLHGGVARIDGKSYQICWFKNETAVGIIFDDGDVGAIPVEMFKPGRDA